MDLQDLGRGERKGQVATGGAHGSPPTPDLTLMGQGLDRGRTHIDKLQFPEVLHSVDGAVATRQEGMDVVLQPQGVQPGGHRWGAVPVIAQSLHLQGEGEGRADRADSSVLMGTPGTMGTQASSRRPHQRMWLG